MNYNEKELSVIQKTYDLILWLIPILGRLPRNHRFTLGEKIANNLYELLEGLIEAKYSPEKEKILRSLNTKLSVIYYQVRLMVDLDLMCDKRYENLSRYLVEIGNELGGWLKSQTKTPPVSLTGTKNGR
jgi:hypothetical protein